MGRWRVVDLPIDRGTEDTAIDAALAAVIHFTVLRRCWRRTVRRQGMDKMRPGLKQFGQLTMEDFDLAPVWASCHSFDSNEPWFDDTDEETFRPWGRQASIRSFGGNVPRASDLSCSQRSRVFR